MLFPASDKKKFIEIDRRPSVDNIAKFVKENSKLEFELAEFEKEAEAMQKRAIARVAFELKEKALSASRLEFPSRWDILLPVEISVPIAFPARKLKNKGDPVNYR